MRDPQRIKRVLSLLRALWETYPDLRFGQLVALIKSNYKKDLGVSEESFLRDIFNAEDDEIEKVLKELLRGESKKPI